MFELCLMEKSNSFTERVKALMKNQMFDGKNTAETTVRTAPNGHVNTTPVTMLKSWVPPSRK